MSSTNIPKVGTLVSSAITEQALTDLCVNLVCQMLGIDTDPTSDTYDPLCYARVRGEYQEEGQPAWLISEEVVFVTAFLENDPYAGIRDRGIEANDDESYNQTTIYTRVWKVEVVVYGPDAEDRARQIKSCMYLDFVYDAFAASSLYPQTDFPEPQRRPERWANQWWKRWDFEFRMNEQVEESIVQPSMASVELIIVDDTGVVLDETIDL
jgi:hypothetical protein